MNIHEYQAKKILSQYGIQTPKGMIAYTPEEAKRVSSQVSRGPWMVKSQIQSGARNQGYFLEKRAGRKGGIRLAKTKKELMAEAAKMLGSTLVTVQTGPKGKLVSRVYVEDYNKVEKIFYTGMVIDRLKASITLLIAETKDEEIAGIAISHPEKILQVPLDLITGADSEQIAKVMNFLKFGEKSRKYMETFINGLHQAFVDYDATMIEVNPVGLMKNGQIVALDAKMSFDDNAMFRHKEIKILRDEYESEERELNAAKYGFQYSEFDGNIGCIVNGDGIALACMDLIQNHGAGTACFLNVKGGVDKDKIAAGIKIIMTNPRVEGILINILGGFLRCNLIADGIVSAASEVGLNVPLVVRFEGTNKDEAKEILAASKLPLIIADNMEESVALLLKAVEESE
ncbi:MAG: ADP-forming succinate--CoA ligase subunit beta [Lactobacillus sp.]|jgi:succinyl-CoA synthetase beta subunit|nr:ADP-forming succinate--CoA ligase subunit beta [Lactobacillus sp.]